MNPSVHSDTLGPDADLRLATQSAELRSRIELLRDAVWDVNLVALAAHDAAALADLCQGAGHSSAADHLYALVGRLSSHIHGGSAPDDDNRALLASLFESAAAQLPALAESAPATEPGFGYEATEAMGDAANLAEYDGFDTDSARLLGDLSIVDDRFSPFAPDPPPVRVVELPGAGSLPDAPDWSLEPEAEAPGALLIPPAAATPARPRSAPDPAPPAKRAAPAGSSQYADDLLAPLPARTAGAGTSSAPSSSPGEQRTAYLLAGETSYAAALEAALAGAGFEVHHFTDAEELAETVGALVPAAVLVAPDAFSELAPVATAVANARKRANAPILLITIAADGGIPTRLAAMRAGADAFLAEPAEPAHVVARLGELDAAGTTEPFRVMIVEDDRPQAVFAESILRKAGMQTRAVHDPLEAIDALEAFDPELILMDLLMPGCDGIELTTLIRERDRYANVPIVFLSGEQNADRRYDALSVGGDDFLEKPIKPKFLLSAVGNRVRRARAVRQKTGGAQQAERPLALYDRTRLVERAGESLLGATTATPGGLLFLIVDGAQALREKLGLMAFDLALQQAGAMLAESLGPGELAARFGDSSFVVLAPQSNREGLAALAEKLSRAFADRLIQSESGSLTLAASVGIALFNQGWRDAPAMVNATERAATRARSGGGNRIAISTGPETNDASDGDALLRSAVVAALAAGGLQLLFQPIAALHGGGDEIFQVLLRLRDERGRRYSAAEIVPMAERNGLIDDIDRAVLARCAEILAKQLERGRQTTLLVSQSIHALADPSRVEWLSRTTETAGIPADRLIVELRHDEVTPRLATSAAWLGALRSAGFRTAIGTFEPNAAAVQSLQHLPVDILRISGRFVAQMDKARAAILGDVVGAAHAHGARVVVPMVEDARTAAALWGTGVDFIQGDFIQGAGSDLDFDFNAATF